MRLDRVLAVGTAFWLLGGVGLVNGAAPVAPPQPQGVVRTPGGDVPYYARTDRAYHDDEWAVIVFYRPPECVPDDFNLLQFFDVPGAFFCGPPTASGWDIWENGPGVDPAPIKSQLEGLGAVPVWLVSWPELEMAAQDGVLTMAELEGLSSLVRGQAAFYNESLLIGRKLTIVANGVLEDGRSFHVQITNVDKPQNMNVTVVLH
jgi:hypothetical protein